MRVAAPRVSGDPSEPACRGIVGRIGGDRPGPKEEAMRCDVCGNDYDKSFQVTQMGKTMTFDSFECAIHALAPVCAHCQCRIVGHGVEANGAIFCCVHCAKQEGVRELRDRA
jgi:hypothetical protein